MKKNIISPIKFLTITILVTGAFVAGFFTKDLFEINCHKEYKFINTEIVCGNKVVIEKTGYAKTQSDIEKYIAKSKTDGLIIETGVYFRDLENGPVFGINETASFAPASLLKLPFSLVYMQIADIEPRILEKQLSFQKSAISIQQTIAPSKVIVPDTLYTVEELLRNMLSYSDNNSYALLQDYLTQTGREKLINDTYLELGILTPEDIYDGVISVRRYAGILRALYNVSYLSAEGSEKVLLWLKESDFKEGLPKGVPKDISVAHKFGERFVDDGTKQLHDCGIIYYPDNPYLLCVMTKGYDFKDQLVVIQEISSLVYKEVKSRKL